VIAARSRPAVSREDDEVAGGSAPGVRSVGDVQVRLVVGSESAGQLAGRRESRDGFVQIGRGVEIATPEVLAVGRVGAARIALLSTVVDDRNASAEDHVGERVLEQRRVLDGVQPARVVVVVEESSQCGRIREGGADLVVHVDEILAAALLLVEVVHGVVYGVVQKARHEICITGQIVDTAVEYLTDGIDASSVGEARPEIFFDVLDRVDTDAVERVLLHQPANPFLVDILDFRAFSVDIWEVCNAAVLDAVLIRVVDLAGCVVGAALVHRLGLVVRNVARAHVVCDNIDHDIDTLVMGRLDKILQIVRSTIVRVDAVQVLCPIPMVSARFI